MLVRPAEQSFQRGVVALAEQRGREAMALFEAALELEARYGTIQPQGRYRSFYGLCLSLEDHREREGIRFCQEGLTLDSFNPDVYWNLGRVLLKAGRKRKAYEVLMQGVILEPGHRGIRSELARLGVRRKPVLRFLSREHIFNVLLGRIFVRWPSTL